MDFKTAVANVKGACDVVSEVERAGVSLSSSGASFKGLCPFHEEKTPSFYVNPALGTFHCFGCGVGGDVIAFRQRVTGADFMTALSEMAAEVGVSLEGVVGGGDRTRAKDMASLRACVEESARFFAARFAALPPSHPAIRQITDRGLSPSDMEYGYAPESRHELADHLHAAGFTQDTCVSAGVCRRSTRGSGMFDFWSGRLMFTIRDTMGRVVGFAGRRLFDSDPMKGKYVNSPAGDLFDKASVMFHLSDARKSAASEHTLYVVEGQFDVAAFVAAGMPNVSAPGGTAFTPKQGVACSRLVGERGRVVVVFDPDDAGQAAAEKVFTSMPDLLERLHVVTGLDADPSDVVRDHGPAALAQAVTHTVPLVEYVLSRAASGVDVTSAGGRSDALARRVAVLAAMPPGPLVDVYAREVALDSMVSVRQVSDEVSAARHRRASHPVPHTATPATPAPDDPPARPPTSTSVVAGVDQTAQVAWFTSGTGAGVARLMVMSLADRRLLPDLAVSAKGILPPSLCRVAAEALHIPEGTPVIAESFTYDRIVTFLVSCRLPTHWEHMTLSARRALLVQASDTVRRVLRQQARHGIQQSMSQAVRGAPSGDADFLSKVLRKEHDELVHRGLTSV